MCRACNIERALLRILCAAGVVAQRPGGRVVTLDRVTSRARRPARSAYVAAVRRFQSPNQQVYISVFRRCAALRLTRQRSFRLQSKAISSGRANMNASLHRGCQRLQWASHPADTARSVVAASRSGTACHHTDKCPRQQQPEQQPEQQQHPSAASRRLALAAAALAPLALWCGRASAAGGGLQTAPCGLKWEDLTVGDGPPPIRGAFYK